MSRQRLILFRLFLDANFPLRWETLGYTTPTNQPKQQRHQMQDLFHQPEQKWDQGPSTPHLVKFSKSCQNLFMLLVSAYISDVFGGGDDSDNGDDPERSSFGSHGLPGRVSTRWEASYRVTLYANPLHCSALKYQYIPSLPNCNIVSKTTVHKSLPPIVGWTCIVV